MGNYGYSCLLLYSSVLLLYLTIHCSCSIMFSYLFEAIQQGYFINFFDLLYLYYFVITKVFLTSGLNIYFQITKVILEHSFIIKLAFFFYHHTQESCSPDWFFPPINDSHYFFCYFDYVEMKQDSINDHRKAASNLCQWEISHSKMMRKGNESRWIGGNNTIFHWKRSMHLKTNNILTSIASFLFYRK